MQNVGYQLENRNEKLGLYKDLFLTLLGDPIICNFFSIFCKSKIYFNHKANSYRTRTLEII